MNQRELKENLFKLPFYLSIPAKARRYFAKLMCGIQRYFLKRYILTLTSIENECYNMDKYFYHSDVSK